MIWAAIVTGCALLMAAVAWLLRAKARARVVELVAVAAERAYADQERRDADARKAKLAKQAAHDVAEVPAMSDEQLEREINR